MQSLPGVRSQRHIHIYELTAQVYRQIDTHTGAAKRHIIRKETAKEQREKRDRDENNLDVSEGEFNITKEQR